MITQIKNHDKLTRRPIMETLHTVDNLRVRKLLHRQQFLLRHLKVSICRLLLRRTINPILLSHNFRHLTKRALSQLSLLFKLFFKFFHRLSNQIFPHFSLLCLTFHQRQFRFMAL